MTHPELRFQTEGVDSGADSAIQRHLFPAMYDIGEKADLSEFKATSYWEAIKQFGNYFVREARHSGLSPEQLGEAVHVALTATKPKARYAVVPQRFKNWTLPRLLPTRMLDTAIARQMGLIKP